MHELNLRVLQRQKLNKLVEDEVTRREKSSPTNVTPVLTKPAMKKIDEQNNRWLIFVDILYTLLGVSQITQGAILCYVFFDAKDKL